MLAYSSTIAKSPLHLSPEKGEGVRRPTRRQLRRRATVLSDGSLSTGNLIPPQMSAVTPLLREDFLKNSAQGGQYECPGVYAAFNASSDLQYVGISRNCGKSLERHFQELNQELCASVRVCALEGADRDALQLAWKQWIQEHMDAVGSVPPGNAKGVNTWNPQPRTVMKQGIRLTKPGVPLNIPMEELIGKLVNDFKVIAFIKGSRTEPKCGFSYQMLTTLNALRVDYETVDVLDEESNPGLRETIKLYSQWPTIPQLYVGGEFVGGTDIVQDMVASGELQKLIG